MPHTVNNNPESRTSNVEPGFSPDPRTSDLALNSVSLIDYLEVIAKRSRMIFLVTLAAAVVSIIYCLFLPNIYTAKALILPSQGDKGMTTAMMAQLGGLASLVAGGAGGSVGIPTTTDLYMSMLKSEAVEDPIIDRFKLMEVYKKKYRTDLYKVLENRSKISAGKKDGIITITIDDKDPKRAAEIANAYVEELGKLTVRLNVTGAGQNRSFLEDRLTIAKTDLAKAEENLKEFQEKNKAVHVTAQAEATIRGIADMRARLAAQEVQLATYRRRFTESSEEVKNLTTSVNNLRAQMARLEGEGGISAIPSVGSVPSLAQEYLRRMREYKIQESLVELLTKQYEMAKLSEAKDISPFQVLLKARVPERKSKPARSRMVLIATVTAFFMSLISAFVLENFAQMSDEYRVRWRGLLSGLPFYRRGNVV
jgi:tyrosine-protein kinase Etk/Wzc